MRAADALLNEMCPDQPIGTRESRMRYARRGGAPPGQKVLNVYGNADEGDMSTGYRHNGPAHSDRVGRRGVAAMLKAWRQPGAVCRSCHSTSGGHGSASAASGRRAAVLRRGDAARCAERHTRRREPWR
jgi:hypothetical protein